MFQVIYLYCYLVELSKTQHYWNCLCTINLIYVLWSKMYIVKGVCVV